MYFHSFLQFLFLLPLPVGNFDTFPRKKRRAIKRQTLQKDSQRDEILTLPQTWLFSEFLKNFDFWHNCNFEQFDKYDSSLMLPNSQLFLSDQSISILASMIFRCILRFGGDNFFAQLFSLVFFFDVLDIPTYPAIRRWWRVGGRWLGRLGVNVRS